jgi:hypothetical protein
LTLLFNIVLQILFRAIRPEQERKGIQIENEDIKLFLFGDSVIVYIKRSQNSTPRLLEIINSLDKVAGHNINIQNSVAFL